MASLIVGAGLLIHNKIHDKKEMKREKKRLAYESRYRELEQEHMSRQEKLGVQTSGGGGGAGGTGVEDPQHTANAGERMVASRRRSSESLSRKDLDDDPTKWVDDVIRAKEAQGKSLG